MTAAANVGPAAVDMSHRAACIPGRNMRSHGVMRTADQLSPGRCDLERSEVSTDAKTDCKSGFCLFRDMSSETGACSRDVTQR